MTEYTFPIANKSILFNEMKAIKLYQFNMLFMQYRVLSFDCFLWFDSDRMIIDETGSLIVPEFDEMGIKEGKREVLHEM